MKEILLESTYPDGTNLVVEKEGHEIRWKVNDKIHMLIDKIGHDENECCGHADMIIKNAIVKTPHVLVAGLGFGHTTSDLIRSGCTVDTIEINQDVINFGKKNHKDLGNIICDDFYNYVNNTSKKYDAIFLQLDFVGIDKDHSEFGLCCKTNNQMYNTKFYKKLYNTLNNKGYFLFDALSEIGNLSLVDEINDIGYYATYELYPFWDVSVTDINHICIEGYKC